MKILLIIIGILILAVIAEVIREQLTFVIKQYQLSTRKLQDSVRIVFLSDLHGRQYGKKNCKLLDSIRRADPDLILLGGDIITSSNPKSYSGALHFLREAAEIAPVYYSYGNHESKKLCKNVLSANGIQRYLEKVRNLGITLLDNRHIVVTVKNSRFHISGLSLPEKCYSRVNSENLSLNYLQERLLPCNTDSYEILLVHSPIAEPVYRQWGADLILCGHYHGGVIRFANRGFITPQFQFLVPESYGLSMQNKQCRITTSGIGTHKLPLRFLNPAEVVVIDLN